MAKPTPQTEDKTSVVTPQALRRLTDAVERLLTQPARRAEPGLVRIRNSQLLSAVIGSVGLVLFAFGIERAVDGIPLLSNAASLVVIGLLLLAISGALFRKLG